MWLYARHDKRRCSLIAAPFDQGFFFGKYDVCRSSKFWSYKVLLRSNSQNSGAKSSTHVRRRNNKSEILLFLVIRQFCLFGCFVFDPNLSSDLFLSVRQIRTVRIVPNPTYAGQRRYSTLFVRLLPSRPNFQSQLHAVKSNTSLIYAGSPLRSKISLCLLIT